MPWAQIDDVAGRSPHGERGLKYGIHFAGRLVGSVALLTESVD